MDRKIRMATPSDVVKGRIKSRVSSPVGAEALLLVLITHEAPDDRRH